MVKGIALEDGHIRSVRLSSPDRGRECDSRVISTSETPFWYEKAIQWLGNAMYQAQLDDASLGSSAVQNSSTSVGFVKLQVTNVL